MEIKKENSEVVGLSKHHGIGGERKHTREFDIETSSKLIECKNIQWPDLKNYHNLPEPKQKYIDKLKSTFIQQKKIAESLGKEFEIRSAPAIPQEWQKFLNEHAIKFIERCIK